MELVLLSGGAGKRLWPLSNDSRSKQFLKVLDNGESLESMIQRVWGQLQILQLTESTIISTGKSQVEIIYSQLGNQIPLIIEPERRDTFPAIALASTYLYSIKNIKLNEVVVVLPVDPFVDISFFERIKDLELILNSNDANIALMGVNPTYPSEKYGYIVPGQIKTDCFQVSHFKEKPSETEAKELIKQNALWNCGVFAFKLEYVLTLLLKKGFPIEYNLLFEKYQNIERISFDYAVVEKSKKVITIPYNGKWKDLGSWNTLTEEMSKNQIGKGTISNDSTNTHIVNELDIPVTVLGIKDAVIAASPDGILVVHKNESSRVKDILKDFEQRPMYEERRWGWYKVLDYSKYNGSSEFLTKRVCIKAGCNLSYQMHYSRSEVWTILTGDGEVAFNDKIRPIKAGDVLIIPKETKHGIKANTDLEFIEVQTGSQLIEEDIVRIYMRWEDVENHCNTAIQ